jgi:Zn-finger nucleic acid-binding protein
VAECDGCGAPVRLDRATGVLVCDHCGSQQEASGVVQHLELLSETTNQCPTCSSPLAKARLEGHPLLCCPRCYGMLIEMNRFATVIDAVRMEERSVRIALPRRQNPGDRLLKCPACGQPMLCHIYGGPGNVVIDSCERCQLNWLDSGELRRIAMAPDSTSSV